MLAPPGNNIEFVQAQAFAKRVATFKQLAEAIQEQLKNWPKSGMLITPGIFWIEVDFRDKAYGVIFARRPNKINLMNVYQLSEERHEFEQRKQEFKKRP